MYISILDYSNGTVSIIYDEENVTENMQNEDVYTLLETLGFRESEIYFMISKENPYEPVDEYVTLRERCEDVDEDRIEELSHYLNLSAEDLTGKEVHNG